MQGKDSFKLSIELIPETSFYANVRSEVTKAQWDIIRKKCYAKANNVCEICGGKGKQHAVECHEIWKFEGKTQTLIGFIALCPSCHEVKHFGLAKLRGNEERALKHFMKINKCNKSKALRYIDDVFDEWHKRNQIEWKLNTSLIKEYKNE